MRNNLHNLKADFPLGVFTTITGVSGSRKSSLVSQVLVELVAKALGQNLEPDTEDEIDLERAAPVTLGDHIVSGMEKHQAAGQSGSKANRTNAPLNLATYTGLFDQVRNIYAATRWRSRGPS
jgi:excinuclease ABC subunit A